MKLLFWKNKSNTTINPATDDTLQAISAQTNLLSFDAGANPANLMVNVAAISPGADIGILNANNVPINPATQETLASVQSAFSQITFDASAGSAIKTTGVAPTLSSVVNVKNTASVNINPASDEATILWRRMLKLMEAKATVDANKNKRVTVDAFGTGITTGVGASGAGIPLVTISNDFSENLTGLYTSTSYVGWNDQMYQDVARDAYARGVRSKLIFS